MQNEAQIRALEVCIQNLFRGASLEEITEIYPQWSDSLLKPLEAAQVLRVYTRSLEPIGDDLGKSRANLLATAHDLWNKRSISAIFRANRFGIFMIVIILSMAIALFGLLTVVSTSLPGQPLYPVKELAWQARLIISQQRDDHLELEQAYDQERLEEIRSLRNMGQSLIVNFAGPLTQDQPDVWKIAEIPALISSGTRIVGKVQPQIWVEVDALLRNDGVLEVIQIQPREYKITGNLQMITPEELIVNNLSITVDEETVVHGSPMANSPVLIIARQDADGRLRVRLIENLEE